MIDFFSRVYFPNSKILKRKKEKKIVEKEGKNKNEELALIPSSKDRIFIDMIL